MNTQSHIAEETYVKLDNLTIDISETNNQDDDSRADRIMFGIAPYLITIVVLLMILYTVSTILKL